MLEASYELFKHKVQVSFFSLLFFLNSAKKYVDAIYFHLPNCNKPAGTVALYPLIKVFSLAAIG